MASYRKSHSCPPENGQSGTLTLIRQPRMSVWALGHADAKHVQCSSFGQSNQTHTTISIHDDLIFHIWTSGAGACPRAQTNDRFFWRSVGAAAASPPRKVYNCDQWTGRFQCIMYLDLYGSWTAKHHMYAECDTICIAIYVTERRFRVI